MSIDDARAFSQREKCWTGNIQEATLIHQFNGVGGCKKFRRRRRRRVVMACPGHIVLAQRSRSGRSNGRKTLFHFTYSVEVHHEPSVLEESPPQQIQATTQARPSPAC